MERREKGLEKKELELMVEKLKLAGKRGGRSSTPPPTWRLVDSQHNANTVQQEFLNSPSSKTLSARNLCAKLWEFHSYHLEVPHHNHSPSHQPASARDSRRHVLQASDVQHRRSIDRNGSSRQSVSPSSCHRFMEVTQESPRELVKVLDHIWHLEEQDPSNIAIVKGLLMELDLSQTQVKELLQENNENKHEMENLMKQITEDKLVNKKKEHDKIKAAVKSVKEEIEDERRLRKQSESLHTRLALELSEVNSSFCDALRDLEREKKTRILLENLCDDFAEGVRDYDHEIRSIMHNANNDRVKGDNLNRLILHISEAWLDERTQMKLKLVQEGNGSDLPHTHSIVDKLRVDIETFLHAKRSIDLKRYSNSSIEEHNEIHPCLRSLDSFQLKETKHSPHNFTKEESVSTNIFEQKRTSDIGHNKCFVESKSSEMRRYRTNLLNAPSPRISTLCETIQGPQEHDRGRTKRINSGHSQVGNSSMSSEGDKVYPESMCRVDSCFHSAIKVNGSPVKQWKTTLIVPDLNKSHYKFPRGVKDNTFMAKLLEARLEGHKSCSKNS